MIRDFIELLDILYQNPQMRLEELMGSDAFSYTESGAVSNEAGDGYVEFEL